MTRYQWTVLLVAWLGWVFDIMDTSLFVFAKGPMLTEFLGGAEAYKLQGPQIEGRLQLVFLLGWALGGLIFGVLADRWGRTRTMICTILIYCLFTGLTALCQTVEQVALIRFLTALGIGGEWAAGAALIAEVLPENRRAFGAAALQTAAAVGPILGALINLAIPPENWRWLFWVGVAPAFVTVLIRIWVKEPENTLTPGPSPARGEGGRNPLRQLFSDPVSRKRAFVALAIGVVGIAGAQNVAFWLPNLVQAVSEGASAADIQARKSWATMTLHIGTLIGVILVPWLCTKWGRKRAIGAFFVASPLAILAATYGGQNYGQLLLFAPLMSLFAIGVSAAFVLYFPELFPSRYRATGAGFAYNCGRIITAGFPVLTGSLTAAFSGSVIMAVFVTSAILLVIGLAALPFAPETRGQPLPE